MPTKGGPTKESQRRRAESEPDTTWREQAACAGVDPDLFFPLGESGPVNEPMIDAAKALCEECVVKQDCLNYVLANNEKYGIWGGTTPKERRAIIKRGWLDSQVKRSA